jgi:anaerobic C4-dicarboxylate transporter
MMAFWIALFGGAWLVATVVERQYWPVKNWVSRTLKRLRGG